MAFQELNEEKHRIQHPCSTAGPVLVFFFHFFLFQQAHFGDRAMIFARFSQNVGRAHNAVGTFHHSGDSPIGPMSSRLIGLDDDVVFF